MPTAPSTIRGPGGDHRVRLLPAQHRLCDLLRVGEMADPDLDDLEPGDRHPLGHLPREFGRDDVGRPA
jgi:hypothetical protein